MSTIHLHWTTTATPEQYIAGLTDFGPGRSNLFGNSADAYLKVHHKGLSHADITEGSNGIWERLHYDWSDPDRVVLTTTDSNVWGGASGHTYTFTRRPDGTTDIDVVVVRDGKNLKGWVLGFVLGSLGKRVLETAFENSVKAIEVRNSTSRRREMVAVAVGPSPSVSRLAMRRLGLREDSLQPWRCKVEEGAHLDRQKPVSRVYKVDRPWCGLEVIEHGRQDSALRSCLELIGEGDCNSDAGAGCSIRGLSAADDEPRIHRHRNGRLVSDECPDIGCPKGGIMDAIMPG